jgi:hypothetical protein
MSYDGTDWVGCRYAASLRACVCTVPAELLSAGDRESWRVLGLCRFVYLASCGYVVMACSIYLVAWRGIGKVALFLGLALRAGGELRIWMNGWKEGSSLLFSSLWFGLLVCVGVVFCEVGR